MSAASRRRKAAPQPRAPFDWYVEPRWAVEALFDQYPILGTVGDPCCGQGTIPEVARDRGHAIVAADIIDRGYARLTAVRDFLHDPSPFIGVEHLWMNPPYSYRPGIAEAFVRQALALGPQTVAVLVPNNWLSSQTRFRLFVDLPPARILYFTERPSMPPGHMIEALGERAFKGARVNYCWILWERERTLTETMWIPPRPDAARK